MKYTVKCTDGSDSNCYEELDVEIGIIGLTAEQLDEIIEHDRAELTKQQIEMNRIVLDEHDQKILDEEGVISYPIYIDNTVCGACGSDQSYDNEGNNISHL